MAWPTDDTIRAERTCSRSGQRGSSPTRSLPRRHETSCSILAEELRILAGQVQVREGDTDTVPSGLGIYTSCSTPTAGDADAMAVWKTSVQAAKIAAHLLAVGEEDVG